MKSLRIFRATPALRARLPPFRHLRIGERATSLLETGGARHSA
jgi:hypothetical protein